MGTVMALDLDRLIQGPVQNTFGVPVRFFPIVSQPAVPYYDGRGQFNVQMIEIPTEGGQVLVSRLYKLRIRVSEFLMLPQRGDQVYIAPAGVSQVPGNVSSNFALDKHDVDRAGSMIFALKATTKV